jgi:hypothetical protein
VTIAADHTTSREPIHHATRFSFQAPTTCGEIDTPKPAAGDWRFVECPNA